MARRNRKTLKNFFQSGQMPSQEDFTDLIDSMVNIIDEGFSKSVNDGLELSSVADSDKLISFFKNIEDKSPIWSCETNKENNNLSFSNSLGEKVLVLNEDKKVGINTENPESTLDVNGVLSCKGRKGTFKSGVVPANGKWNSIISNLDGCNAFEVMAGVGKRKSGKYSLLHAFALNVFNSESKISYNQSFFKTWCNTMKLKWSGSMHDYSLDIRTKSDLGEDIYINYYITQLWFDPYMDSSIKKTD
ncbi:MAG: hypothetical protein MI922_05105 [Bacteroidales bacterium]|nr:hypothetical protein [Bacteroidales bacterium]